MSSSLFEASSSFKTFYGLTDEFPITTSVRQGDPLSPLVYIFITDVLHEGLRKNPIFGDKTGYRFSNAPRVRVSSLGYADDTVVNHGQICGKCTNGFEIFASTTDSNSMRKSANS